MADFGNYEQLQFVIVQQCSISITERVARVKQIYPDESLHQEIFVSSSDTSKFRLITILFSPSFHREEAASTRFRWIPCFSLRFQKFSSTVESSRESVKAKNKQSI